MKKLQLIFITNVLIYCLNIFKFYEIDYHLVKYENVISNFKKEINNLIKIFKFKL